MAMGQDFHMKDEKRGYLRLDHDISSDHRLANMDKRQPPVLLGTLGAPTPTPLPPQPVPPLSPFLHSRSPIWHLQSPCLAAIPSPRRDAPHRTAEIYTHIRYWEEIGQEPNTPIGPHHSSLPSLSHAPHLPPGQCPVHLPCLGPSAYQLQVLDFSSIQSNFIKAGERLVQEFLGTLPCQRLEGWPCRSLSQRWETGGEVEQVPLGETPRDTNL